MFKENDIYYEEGIYSDEEASRSNYRECAVEVVRDLFVCNFDNALDETGFGPKLHGVRVARDVVNVLYNSGVALANRSIDDLEDQRILNVFLESMRAEMVRLLRDKRSINLHAQSETDSTKEAKDRGNLN